MKQIEIIEALLSGYNNIEQMGTYDPSRGLEYFGEGTRIVNGMINPLNKYIYSYDEPLRNCDTEFMPDCVLRDGYDIEISLHKIDTED